MSGQQSPSRKLCLSAIVRAATWALAKNLVVSAIVLGPGFVLLYSSPVAGMLWLFAGSFGMMAWTYRKPWRLMLIACFIPPLSAALCYAFQLWMFGVPSTSWLGIAAGIGLAIGLFRGSVHEVYIESKSIFARRTISYLLIWVAAYGATQALGLMARKDLLPAGLVTGAFSTAMLAAVSMVVFFKYRRLRATLASIAAVLIIGVPAAVGQTSDGQPSPEQIIGKLLSLEEAKIPGHSMVLGELETFSRSSLSSNAIQVFNSRQANFNTDRTAKLILDVGQYSDSAEAHAGFSSMTSEPGWTVLDIGDQAKTRNHTGRGFGETTVSETIVWSTWNNWTVRVQLTEYTPKSAQSNNAARQSQALEIARLVLKRLPGVVQSTVPAEPAFSAKPRPRNSTGPASPPNVGSQSELSIPENAEEIAIGVALILVSAGVSVSVAQSVAAAVAQAVQAGIEVSTQDIWDEVLRRNGELASRDNRPVRPSGSGEPGENGIPDRHTGDPWIDGVMRDEGDHASGRRPGSGNYRDRIHELFHGNDPGGASSDPDSMEAEARARARSRLESLLAQHRGGTQDPNSPDAGADAMYSDRDESSDPGSSASGEHTTAGPTEGEAGPDWLYSEHETEGIDPGPFPDQDVPPRPPSMEQLQADASDVARRRLDGLIPMGNEPPGELEDPELETRLPPPPFESGYDRRPINSPGGTSYATGQNDWLGNKPPLDGGATASDNARSIRDRALDDARALRDRFWPPQDTDSLPDSRSPDSPTPTDPAAGPERTGNAVDPAGSTAAGIMDPGGTSPSTESDPGERPTVANAGGDGHIESDVGEYRPVSPTAGGGRDSPDLAPDRNSGRVPGDRVQTGQETGGQETGRPPVSTDHPVFDQHGNEVAYRQPDGSLVHPDLGPVHTITSEQSGGAILGVRQDPAGSTSQPVSGTGEGPSTNAEGSFVQFDETGRPHLVTPTVPDVAPSSGPVYDPITIDPDGVIRNRQGTMVGRQLPDGQRVDIDGNPMETRNRSGVVERRPVNINPDGIISDRQTGREIGRQLPDGNSVDARGNPIVVNNGNLEIPSESGNLGDGVLDRRSGDGSYKPNESLITDLTPQSLEQGADGSHQLPDGTPVSNAPRSTPRAGLDHAVRSAWDRVNADADGMIPGPAGVPVGRIDSNGNMWTLGNQPVRITGVGPRGNDGLAWVRTEEGAVIGRADPRASSGGQIADALSSPPGNPALADLATGNAPRQPEIDKSRLPGAMTPGQSTSNPPSSAPGPATSVPTTGTDVATSARERTGATPFTPAPSDTAPATGRTSTSVDQVGGSPETAVTPDSSETGRRPTVDPSATGPAPSQPQTTVTPDPSQTTRRPAVEPSATGARPSQPETTVTPDSSETGRRPTADPSVTGPAPAQPNTSVTPDPSQTTRRPTVDPSATGAPPSQPETPFAPDSSETGRRPTADPSVTGPPPAQPNTTVTPDPSQTIRRPTVDPSAAGPVMPRPAPVSAPERSGTGSVPDTTHAGASGSVPDARVSPSGTAAGPSAGNAAGTIPDTNSAAGVGAPSRGQRAVGGVAILADLASNTSQNMQEGMGAVEAVTVSGIQVAAGELAGSAISGPTPGMALGGNMAASALLPNGASTILPDQFAADIVKTGWQGVGAALNSIQNRDSAALVAFIDAKAEEPGVGAVSGYFRGARYVYDVNYGNRYANDAQTSYGQSAVDNAVVLWDRTQTMVNEMETGRHGIVATGTGSIIGETARFVSSPIDHTTQRFGRDAGLLISHLDSKYNDGAGARYMQDVSGFAHNSYDSASSGLQEMISAAREKF